MTDDLMSQLEQILSENADAEWTEPNEESLEQDDTRPINSPIDNDTLQQFIAILEPMGETNPGLVNMISLALVANRIGMENQVLEAILPFAITIKIAQAMGLLGK